MTATIKARVSLNLPASLKGAAVAFLRGAPDVPPPAADLKDP